MLVELFTSQGCSSCPPADAFVRDLPKLGLGRDKVIPLTFHVDYWDRLGWPDPFASPAFTDRQQWYARSGKLRSPDGPAGLDGLYTPQMIVDGSVHFTGQRRQTAVREMGRAAARAPSFDLAVQAGARGSTIEITVQIAEVDVKRDLDWRVFGALAAKKARTRSRTAKTPARPWTNRRWCGRSRTGFRSAGRGARRGLAFSPRPCLVTRRGRRVRSSPRRRANRCGPGAGGGAAGPGERAAPRHLPVSGASKARMWVAEIRRYPVKSMAGERLTEAEIGPDGIPGIGSSTSRTQRGRVVTSRPGRSCSSPRDPGRGRRASCRRPPVAPPESRVTSRRPPVPGTRLARDDGRSGSTYFLCSSRLTVLSLPRLRSPPVSPEPIIAGVPGLAERGGKIATSRSGARSSGSSASGSDAS